MEHSKDRQHEEQKFSGDNASLQTPTELPIVDLTTLGAKGEQINSALESACIKGDIATVEYLLKTHNISINVEIRTEKLACTNTIPVVRVTLLMLAAYSDQENLLDFLLKQERIDVSKSIDDDPQDGRTALDLALKCGGWKTFDGIREGIVAKLLGAGANINRHHEITYPFTPPVPNSPPVTFYSTPLISAWLWKLPEVANRLVTEWGASIDDSEAVFKSNPYNPSGREGVPEQIRRSRENLARHQEMQRSIPVAQPVANQVQPVLVEQKQLVEPLAPLPLYEENPQTARIQELVTQLDESASLSRHSVQHQDENGATPSAHQENAPVVTLLREHREQSGSLAAPVVEQLAPVVAQSASTVQLGIRVKKRQTCF